MNARTLTYLVLGVLVAGTALLVMNRPKSSTQARPQASDLAGLGSTAGASSGPNLVVRVDGVEVEDAQNSLPASSSMSDMAAEGIAPSMISHVRTVGNTQILVLSDGSEVTVGSHNRDRLPESVQYRLQYDRDGQ